MNHAKRPPTPPRRGSGGSRSRQALTPTICCQAFARSCACSRRTTRNRSMTRASSWSGWPTALRRSSSTSSRPSSGCTAPWVSPNPNHVTTPVSHNVAPDQTITVVDPRHPLCGRTLTLVAMTHHATLGRCCVVWLRPQIEQLVPVRATNLEFDPNDISPSPLSLAAVEQLLRVVHDIEHASKGVHSDASPPHPSGATTRARQPDSPPPALGVPVHEPATARAYGADPRRATLGRVSVTPSIF